MGGVQCEPSTGGLTMQTQVTLTLPQELYLNAQRWASMTKQDVAETLSCK